MAKLGKAVKGKSKKGKKKGVKGADSKESALLKKVSEMEQADYQRKLAQQARSMLKVRGRAVAAVPACARGLGRHGGGALVACRALGDRV